MLVPAHVITGNVMPWQNFCTHGVMEEIARTIARYLSLGVEVLGAIIIGIGLLRFLAGYVPSLFHKEQYIANTLLRVQFGSSLTLALELLLAADILRTAVAPTWDDIGKLAAIAAIRTVLNYFLEKELRQMEQQVAPETKAGQH
jgi:uncharacterized membrane protein